MALADLIIVEIMGRRDFHATAAECRVDVSIANDRYLAPGERQAHLPSDQMPVALVIRVHGDRAVAQHGFRTGRRDDEVAAAI